MMAQGGDVDSADEMNELKEHAEEARDRGMLKVSLTMAVLAVVIALFTMLGHRSHTEEVVLQNKATDQWAYFQAKNIRRQNLEVWLDVYPLQKFSGEDAEKTREKWQAAVEKYGDEQKEIESEARKLEAEVKLLSDRATRFDYGESLVAIALVITSITLMTSKRTYWSVGMLVAAVGIAVGVSAFLLH
jgi:hypothetical protein